MKSFFFPVFQTVELDGFRFYFSEGAYKKLQADAKAYGFDAQDIGILAIYSTEYTTV